MTGATGSRRLLAAVLVIPALALGGCASGEDPGSGGESAPAGGEDAAMADESEARWSYRDWPTGPYQVVEDWPKPLPSDRHPHDGWTWGSFGGVYAESPDRIWIAMRGELPLQEGMEPWQAYGATDVVGNAPPTTDGLNSTCNPTSNRRGYERRWEHSIFVVNRDGNLVDEWPHLDQMFGQQPCGRGPH